ncbi:guanylate-binding protein 1-like [Python bivittatus]|uniref:Guanylate-binding protein 1-like n=1 Tax=Python bivittatus TaxID=176946 RepID=A0A9F2WJ62_PYTBI|nr:guanylate-binding protein 1-like [Python bivittatus]
MSKPICLVDSSCHVNPAALKLLRSLTGPLYVVGIFGPKGTGKSFLLDQLAGQEKGFGPMPGMWIQQLAHPTKPEKNLILLDTEGFPEQMDKDKDNLFSKFFCLNALLCDLLIYNTTHNEEPEKELEKLSYVTQLSNKILLSEDDPLENSVLLRSVLPEFVWSLFDVSSDSVWEEMLQSTNNNMDSFLFSLAALEAETPIDCIQKLFPSQKAFCFHCPQVNEEDWGFFPPDSLHPVFQKQFRAFNNYILSKEPKISVSGKVWSYRLELFVDALSQDKPILLSQISETVQEVFFWDDNGSLMDSMKNIASETPAEGSSSEQEYESRQASPFQVLPSWDPTSIMEGPVCLIENKPNEQLQINLDALQLLQSICQPVVVVAIVGLYRTGKSYLMNRLAGKVKGGFSLGATIQANTKGIWMWCLPHPLKPHHTLVLLDTEGLGDVEKSNTKNDSWIFALSILLSSTFIFNSMGTINHYDLEQLHYVAELTKHIEVKASPQQDGERDDGPPDEFAFFFPAFIWVVRDFWLQLELADGRLISEDEYLEIALERQNDIPENQAKIQKYLRQYFPRRKCFVFDRPASRRDLPHLEMLDESNLKPEFLEQAHQFCRYIYQEARPKTIQGGHMVTGTLLGSLAMTYVDAIRSGAVPCIENAVLALAQIENSAAVNDALRCYENMVGLLIDLPTEDVSELFTMHASCEREAIQVFLARAFHDKDQEYQKQLQNQLQSKLEELCLQNQQESLSRCQAVLLELFQELEEKICSRSYLVPGGYQHFLDDQQELVERYHKIPEKGPMAMLALQDFLTSKEPEGQSILHADQTLTKQAKAIAAEKAESEASMRALQLQREIQEQIEQTAKENQRSFEEHRRQLLGKMEEERRRTATEYEWLLNQKIQEQRRLHEQQYQQEVSDLQDEIQRLQFQINQNSRRQDSESCVIF